MDISWVADAWRPAHAWVGASAVSALYVGSLYLWPARYRAPRDHPAVIRRRTVSLLGTCVASCALPWVALQVAPPPLFVISESVERQKLAMPDAAELRRWC